MIPCPDCAAQPDSPHEPGCAIERCSACGGQRLLCDHAGHDPITSRWRGEHPGAHECRMRGWWAVMSEEGWVSCPPETPMAVLDLSRLDYFRRHGRDGLRMTE